MVSLNVYLYRLGKLNREIMNVNANPEGKTEWGGQSIRMLICIYALMIKDGEQITLSNLRRKMHLVSKSQGFKNIDVVIVPEVMEMIGCKLVGDPPVKTDKDITFNKTTPNPKKNMFGNDGVQMGQVTLWIIGLFVPVLKTSREAGINGQVEFTVYGTVQSKSMVRDNMLAPSAKDLTELIPLFVQLGLAVEIKEVVHSGKEQGYIKVGVSESDQFHDEINLTDLVKNKGLRKHAYDIALQLIITMTSVGLITRKVLVVTDTEHTDHSRAILERYPQFF